MSPPTSTNPTQAQLAEQFMARFSKSRVELTSRIEELAKSTSEDVGMLNEKLTSVADEIKSISKTLHDAALFLPSYSIKVI
jgi:predicted PurR-regulated permease PerM